MAVPRGNVRALTPLQNTHPILPVPTSRWPMGRPPRAPHCSSVHVSRLACRGLHTRGTQFPAVWLRRHVEMVGAVNGRVSPPPSYSSRPTPSSAQLLTAGVACPRPVQRSPAMRSTQPSITSSSADLTAEQKAPRSSSKRDEPTPVTSPRCTQFAQ